MTLKTLAAAATVTSAVALSVLAPGSAQAAQLFNFTYSFPGLGAGGTPVSASGTLTTTDLNPGTNAYTITGITGTRIFNGITQQITGLLPPNTLGGNDNLLSATAPFLNGNGFSFTVNGIGDFGNQVNVYLSSPGYTEDAVSVGFGRFSVTRATPVPTPALIPGLVGLSAAVLRKRKANQKAAVSA